MESQFVEDKKTLFRETVKLHSELASVYRVGTRNNNRDRAREKQLWDLIEYNEALLLLSGLDMKEAM